MANGNMMLDDTLKLGRGVGGETRLALPDVLVKSAACLGVAVLAAVPGWIFLKGTFLAYLALLVVLTIAGIFVARKAPVSAGIALGYSALLGLMMGAFSGSVAGQAGSTYLYLIPQAVLGTLCGAGAMLAVYATPFGKKASKAGKFFFGLIIGYFVLSVVSVIAAIFFNVGGGFGFFGVSGIGLLLCMLGVALACWSFLISIGNTADALAAGVPESFSWSLGVSITSSLIWLYVEILRLLAVANR